MNLNRTVISTILAAALFAPAAIPVLAEQESAAEPNPALLDPKLADEKAPEVYRVKMDGKTPSVDGFQQSQV